MRELTYAMWITSIVFVILSVQGTLISVGMGASWGSFIHWDRDKIASKFVTDNFKWPPFSWHFQINVFEWKCMNSVPKCSINNIPALVQILAWHRSGPKPLSEPMMVSLPTHICVIRPQWVNTLRPVVADGIFEYIQWKWFNSVSHLIEMCTQIFKLISFHCCQKRWWCH